MAMRDNAYKAGAAPDRGSGTIEFSGFADLAPPRQAAEAILEIYGSSAAGAARQCADSAFADRRYDDYCYWLVVLGLVEPAGGGTDGPARQAAGNRPAREH